MSGGYFDYQQYNIGNIIDSLERVLDNPERYDFSDYTLECFRDALLVLNESLIYTQRIDWLLSGDDSEETFHKRLVEDLTKVYSKSC